MRASLLLAAGTLAGLPACDPGPRAQPATATEPAAGPERPNNEPMGKAMKLKIGSKTFTATLDDNPATAKLKAMLPLTVEMTELNENEKYYKLSASLPTDAVKPRTIRAGDLMLWQADTLVVFYKTFDTTYGYTRLGRIDDPAGLADTVGAGKVTVTFELE